MHVFLKNSEDQLLAGKRIKVHPLRIKQVLFAVEMGDAFYATQKIKYTLRSGWYMSFLKKQRRLINWRKRTSACVENSQNAL